MSRKTDKTEQLIAGYLEEKQPSAQTKLRIRQRIASATAIPFNSQMQRQTAKIFEKVFASQNDLFVLLNKKFERQMKMSWGR